MGIEILRSGLMGEGNDSSKDLKDLLKILTKEGETKRITMLSPEQFNFVNDLRIKHLIYFKHRPKKSAIPELIEGYMDLAVSETAKKEQNLLQLIKEMHQAQLISDINSKE